MTGDLAIAVLALGIWLYLLLGHGGFWRARERDDVDTPALPTAGEWPDVVAIVPARNEAEMLPASLPSLLAQDYGGSFCVVLIDDQSSDGTADIARRLAAAAKREVVVLEGKPLPAGWTGKVWAMQQGVNHVGGLASAPAYLLFTDADIGYAPDALSRLVARARADDLVLTSLMARLRCESFAERALIPAFIFFFQMLYPFHRVNEGSSTTAAAAGGCMLVGRQALERAGGIGVIRNALIDDCALGRAMKKQGRIWLGLTQRVASLRPYAEVDDIRRMVARSAYAQLRYSPLLLGGTLVGMALTYLAPPAIAVTGTFPASVIAASAWVLMALAFQPTLRFYKQSPLWGLGLPLIATAYLAFTVDSAYQHVRGRSGLWKGRVQTLMAKR